MEARHSIWTTMAPGLLLTGVVGLLALPGAVLAFSSGVSVQPESAEPIAGLDTRATSPGLVPAVAVRSLGQAHPFRFTPAGTTTRPDRSVTVAVRVDAETARAISVRAPLAMAPRTFEPQPGIATPVRIAPTAYNLGVARGYKRFAQPLVPPGDARKIDMPDLAAFKPGTGPASGPSRLTPRIQLDEREVAGNAPRTFAGNSADTVDVGGSYRVTGNLDVTAGVRYQQERNRLQPLTDGKKDSQAVYVGTQFRF